MPGTATTVSPKTFDNFGDLLRFLRKRAELSQRELARQVGYHYSYMSRIETNERAPDPATLMTRFVPALGLEGEPAWTERLLNLGTSGDQTATTRKEETQIPASPEPEPDPSALESDPLPGIFPLSLTPLLGREREVPSVMETLSQSDARLVTLVGPPGIGKTRLAIEIAKQAMGLFAHGVKFIDFAPVTDAQGFLISLTQELDITESPDTPLMARLVGALRQKNLLLILDNFEQCIDAAPQVHQILSGAPEVKALVTSREPLHISGEIQFSVPALPLPREDSVGGDQDLLEYAAIRLFVERARAVQADFQLTPENTGAVLEICRRLDGLPLAIELAAARVKALSPGSMLKQFDRRFDWLAPNKREGQASKQTLHGAIEWSYNLLSGKEQILFRRLAVFSSGRTVESAEAICADEGSPPGDSTPTLAVSEIFDLLIQLTDKSLLFTEVENGETRFNFMETIHDFAREKLVEAGEEAQIKNRHLAYFCQLAERVEMEIEGTDQVAWADRCETEHANMRAAMEWSLKQGADLDLGIRLATNLGLFWFLHSHYSEGLYWFRFFLPKARETSDERILAKLLFRNADLHLNKGELGSAARLINEAVAMCRNIEDKFLLAMALYIQGDTLLAFHDLKAARDAIEECIALCSEVGYPAGQDIALILLGRIHFQMGDHSAARSALQEGLALAAQLSDYWGTASGYWSLGNIFMKEGDYSQARKVFERGLEPSRIIGDRILAGRILMNLAVVTNLQGEYEGSERFAEEAFSIFQSAGDELQQSIPLRMMGYASVHAGNLVRARVLFRESLKASRTAGDIPSQLACVVARAVCVLEEKDLKKAVSLCALIETRRHADGVILLEPDAKTLENVLKQGRDKLGNAAYKKAYEQGGSMILEDIILGLLTE